MNSPEFPESNKLVDFSPYEFIWRSGPHEFIYIDYYAGCLAGVAY